MTKQTTADLAALLLQARSELNFSIRTLARRLRMSPNAVSSFERRRGQPRRLTRYRIEQFLRKFGYLEKEAA